MVKLLASIVLYFLGTYFYMVQLDQIEYPSKQKKTNKMRSEIVQDSKTNFPHFEKKIFKFQNITLGNRLTLKFGLYKVIDDGIRVTALNQEKLAESAKLQCSVAQVLKQSIISVLRKGQILRKNFKLFDPLNPLTQKSSMIVSLKLQFEKIDDVFYEDVKQIEKIYYDPYQQDIDEISKVTTTNKHLISQNLNQIIKSNQKKSQELNRKIKGLDQINQSLRKSGIDLAVLK